MKDRYVQTLENLSNPSRILPTLSCGDHVFIQNQRGRYPTKWDRTGVVMEVKSNDQYVVKVAGTGRLTLRNRRFLRKYDLPHHLQVETVDKVLVPVHSEVVSPSANQSLLVNSEPVETESTESSENLVNADSNRAVVNDINGSFETDVNNVVKTSESHKGIANRLASYNKPGLKEACDSDRIGDKMDDDAGVRRSSRKKSPRMLFDALSGQWKEN